MARRGRKRIYCEEKVTLAARNSWEREREAACRVSEMVDNLLEARERGMEPIGGWDTLYATLKCVNQEYDEALRDAQDYPS